MKVTKAQAEANRAHIVETATTLFRERGYDGVGVADLMGAAGFTHGGFYRHFGSKADLMAEAAACGIAQTTALSEGVSAADFVKAYISRQHRDALAGGCTMAALGGDAARQGAEVRAPFAAGIEGILAALSRDADFAGQDDPAQVRVRALDLLARAVGAIVLSRACPDDSPLADEILAACRSQALPAPKAAPKARAAGRRAAPKRP
ncbi:TetR family transcriptional regulator [uncultured Aquincola sp.]|uniref:TetR/AcrR family transcriptional regulator n=1 Tax=uncultured Aquincola sp. TaxID=886556 RepID=UPI0032B2CBF6